MMGPIGGRTAMAAMAVRLKITPISRSSAPSRFRKRGKCRKRLNASPCVRFASEQSTNGRVKSFACAMSRAF